MPESFREHFDVQLIKRDPNALYFPPDAGVKWPLSDWRDAIGAWAYEKGWNDKPRSEGEWMILAVSELVEAFEEYRNGHLPNEETRIVDGKPEGVRSEIADVFIRLFHYCAVHGIDIGAEVTLKMQYNETREYRHGGKHA